MNYAQVIRSYNIGPAHWYVFRLLEDAENVAVACKDEDSRLQFGSLVGDLSHDGTLLRCVLLEKEDLPDNVRPYLTPPAQTLNREPKPVVQLICTSGVVAK